MYFSFVVRDQQYFINIRNSSIYETLYTSTTLAPSKRENSLRRRNGLATNNDTVFVLNKLFSVRMEWSFLSGGIVTRQKSVLSVDFQT
jgi:hypothetical protein